MCDSILTHNHKIQYHYGILTYRIVYSSSTEINLTQWDPTGDDNICTAFVSNITLFQNNWPDDGM
jgi:hypothetical protein